MMDTIILNVAIPGFDHDSVLREKSGMNKRLRFLQANEATQFIEYGDRAYIDVSHMKGQHKRARNTPLTAYQQSDNDCMKCLRCCGVEWGIGQYVALFPYLDVWKNQKLFSTNVIKMYMLSILLYNAHVCIHG